MTIGVLGSALSPNSPLWKGSASGQEADTIWLDSTTTQRGTANTTPTTLTRRFGSRRGCSRTHWRAGRETMLGDNANNLRSTYVRYSISSDTLIQHVDTEAHFFCQFFAANSAAAFREYFVDYVAGLQVGYQFQKYCRADVGYEIFVKDSETALARFSTGNRVTVDVTFPIFEFEFRFYEHSLFSQPWRSALGCPSGQLLELRQPTPQWSSKKRSDPWPRWTTGRSSARVIRSLTA